MSKNYMTEEPRMGGLLKDIASKATQAFNTTVNAAKSAASDIKSGIDEGNKQSKTNSDMNNVAQAVQRGDYGNGQDRTDALNKAGYDADKVQAQVNKNMQGSRMGSRKGDSRLNEMSNAVVDRWKASGKPWSEFKDSLTDEEKMYTQFGKIFSLYSNDPMMDSGRMGSRKGDVNAYKTAAAQATSMIQNGINNAYKNSDAGITAEAKRNAKAADRAQEVSNRTDQYRKNKPNESMQGGRPDVSGPAQSVISGMKRNINMKGMYTDEEGSRKGASAGQAISLEDQADIIAFAKKHGMKELDGMAMDYLGSFWDSIDDKDKRRLIDAYKRGYFTGVTYD